MACMLLELHAPRVAHKSPLRPAGGGGTVGGAVAFCYDLGLGGRGISCMLSVILSAFGLDLLIALWPTGSALPFAYDLGVGAFRIR